MKKLLLAILAIGMLSCACGSALLAKYEEGSCHGLNYKPQRNINTTWLDRMEMPAYLLGGSKYHLYRLASNDFEDDLAEHKFYYESCLRGYLNIPYQEAEAFAFGNTVDSLTANQLSRGVIELVSNGIHPDAKRRMTITLTDNKSFIFFSNCWLKSDQRSWSLLTKSDKLSPSTQRMIENHAVSLGFDRDQFVFLRYDDCKPLIHSAKAGSGGGWGRHTDSKSEKY